MIAVHTMPSWGLVENDGVFFLDDDARWNTVHCVHTSPVPRVEIAPATQSAVAVTLNLEGYGGALP